MKRDAGMTELVGFMLILSMILAVIGVVTAVCLPIYIEEAEQAKNDEAAEAFLAFTNDVTTLCHAEIEGMSRRSLLPAGILFQDVGLSLTYDETVGDYRELVVTYRIENAVAEDITLSFSKKGVRKNTKSLILPALFIVVNPDDTAEQMESDAGVFWIETTYLGNFETEGKRYHIVSVRLT